MPDSYKEQYPPQVLDNSQEQEAANRVLTGTAMAAHSTGSEVLVYAPPPEPTVEPPPKGPPTELGVLHMGLNSTTDSIVALEDKSTTATTGSVLLINNEYMTVTDASNPNNLAVTRATCGSAIGAHASGTQVSIWGETKAPESSAKRTTAAPPPKQKATPATNTGRK